MGAINRPTMRGSVPDIQGGCGRMMGGEVGVEGEKADWRRRQDSCQGSGSVRRG